ncbi:MAG: hypothetical protein FWC51_01580 [Proteobacteria bacterium]|nr:hypothetical protein [Pseudomonadota bacterium]
MQKNLLKIIINKPGKDIFDFLLNPANSPKWLDVAEERTNEFPVKLGTIFENRGDLNSDEWTRYTVSYYDDGKEFEFTGNNYSVRYILKSLENGATEMTILEQVNAGDLPDPMTMAPFEKLKRLVEE